MNRSTGRLFYVILSGMILIALIIYSAPTVAAGPSPKGTIAPAMPSEEPPPTNTPTATATPATGLIFTGWYKGCTSTPYITCSATVNSTQTDPYRWDFDITYTYGDNRTNMGSNFTLNLAFDTGVFYTDVPIWWEIYPITNEVMPNRWIDVAYSGVPDLNPMSYPSGSWTIPSQPSPYDSFWIRFSRVTEKTETLVRTDSWHVTVATYDYHALTPTPTAAPTSTPTNTPTLTLTNTPTNTPTATFIPSPTPTSTQDRWYTGNSQQNAYGVLANITTPSQSPFLDESGESSYVTTTGPYWIQAGWRYYKSGIWAWSYVEAYSPATGYSIDEYSIHNWGTIKEYKVEWVSGTTWCGWIDGVNKACYEVKSAPSQVNAHSEVHVSSQNELDTWFGIVWYLDSNNTWYLFDQALWREDAPYAVDKNHYYEFRNHGP
ncbi:MAG: hypothetical protein ACOYZ6_17350 [Chloroflexota bacterium]